jgi:hypothetical protein
MALAAGGGGRLSAIPQLQAVLEAALSLRVVHAEHGSTSLPVKPLLAWLGFCRLDRSGRLLLRGLVDYVCRPQIRIMSKGESAEREGRYEGDV